MLVGEYKAPLKPCPFCGHQLKEWENTVCNATIRCQCGVSLSLRKGSSTDEVYERMVIDRWNTRTAHQPGAEQ